MNRLGNETSPYLRQHAENPVDWYPWGEEAFERARKEDRPLLLSVGYSACHWCHVMAHESFEDEATAVEINTSFVPVKVDREERPDVDAIYMEAVQAMSGRGGWPMTVFLTPDGRPFFAGTYFPSRDAHGMPSFRRVLAAISDAWTSRRKDIESQADELTASVRRRASLPDQLVGTGSESAAKDASTDWLDISTQLLDRAVADIAARFDARNGGLAPAPKFPQTSLLELCFRHHRRHHDAVSSEIFTTTLAAMAAGGIYDHLGGGFARYSTDDTWTVPHFEKMLYDQAALTLAYLHGWQITRNERFREVMTETIEYVLNDLATPEPAAGFHAAEDADSEGVEGLFYTWTPDEIREVLPPDLAAAAIDWYGVTDRGNFEGRNVLRRPAPAGRATARPESAAATSNSAAARPPDVEQARRLLLQARSKRVRPGRDDKVLTEWNAMFVSALAQAAGATGHRLWRERALATGTFLLQELRRPDGRFMRSWQEGRTRHLAYAADYAWLVDCFTRLGELTGDATWLEHASETAYEMLRLFFDDRNGSLFSTGSDAEEILVRAVDLLDDATPSASSVGASAMLRLGTLTGDQRLLSCAERLLSLLVPIGSDHPLAIANAIGAMSLAGGGTLEIVVAGERHDLVICVQRRYEPEGVLAWGQRTDSPLWEGRTDGFAYVCHQSRCLSPVTTAEELSDQLDREASAASVIGIPARQSGPITWDDAPGSTLKGEPEGKVSK